MPFAYVKLIRKQCDTSNLNVFFFKFMMLFVSFSLKLARDKYGKLLPVAMRVKIVILLHFYKNKRDTKNSNFVFEIWFVVSNLRGWSIFFL